MCLKTSQAKSCGFVKKVAESVIAQSRRKHHRGLWKCLVEATTIGVGIRRAFAMVDRHCKP
jgi:hypothetical protein